MKLTTIKQQLQAQNIWHADEDIIGMPSVIGYEKKFRWLWMATQLNTFLVASDFGSMAIDKNVIENHLQASFAYAKEHYKGWPRGLQAGMGVITFLLSDNITEEAKAYCEQLKSGKKWAGFSIPVVIDTSNNTFYQFEKNPMWGRIYYPHFRTLINSLK